MIVKWWIAKDLEGNDHGIIEIITLTSYGRLRKTTETLRPAGVPDDIRTRHPQIQIYNVIAKWTYLAVVENWREKTENKLEKNLLVSLRPYQIRDKATQDWDANVKPLKTTLIFNKLLNVAVSMTEFSLQCWSFIIFYFNFPVWRIGEIHTGL